MDSPLLSKLDFKVKKAFLYNAFSNDYNFCKSIYLFILNVKFFNTIK